MKTIFTFLFLVSILCVSKSFAQKQGETAPNFSLSQLSGGEFNLSDYSGKVVFIFWLGYDCPFCKSAAPSIQSQIINDFSGNNNFVAIGIDTWNGSSSAVNSFKSQTGLNVNYLLQGSSVAQSYSTTYDRLSVIDKKGILVYKGAVAAGGDIGNAKTAISAALSVATSVNMLPANLSSFDNYPNPFSNSSTIRFSLKKAGNVQLDLYNFQGKHVRQIVNKNYPEGEQQVSFNRDELSSGVYFLRMINNNDTVTIKLVID